MIFKNKTIKNILWLSIDKIFLLIGGLVVSVVVAKHLGAAELGKISFGLSLSGLAVTLSQWGASHYIFNESAKNPQNGQKLIKSSELFRFSVYIITWFIISIWLFLSEKYHDSYLLISLVIISNLFLGLDIYQFYFNAILKSKVNAIGSMYSKTISMSLRLFFATFSYSTYFFIIPILLNNIILLTYKRLKIKDNNVKELKYRKDFVKAGAPYMMTAMCVYAYMKINEILLVQMIDYTSLGQYIVGFTLAQSWAFVPMSIGISLLSKPIKENKRSVSGFSFVLVNMILFSLPILAFTYFYPHLIISYTFGDEYNQAGDILFLLCVSSLLSSLVFINNRIIGSIPNGGNYLFKKGILSAFFAIPISYILISYYGVEGAAIALIIIEFLNLTIFNYLFDNKVVLKIQLNCFYINDYLSEMKCLLSGGQKNA
ncbi:Oligosaccharide flippase family protein [Vibrio chagasii]|nr:Oligosaccharide flippase family protein [Vibrio chagasii]CAH6867885.1 Oligosaccharide flippase family protein [Vibrio chagasii]CAH7052224.1 Oligosaccharide flippase family protein [Vibrio chagasii]CAH7113383.1 Oligosaccharide flippase family protein [Vibrio chagasii]CAH7303565.1 Oligosaccharide flippase family protein [Vibrio chagasii]